MVNFVTYLACRLPLLLALLLIGAVTLSASGPAPGAAPAGESATARFDYFPPPLVTRPPLRLAFTGDNLLGARMKRLIPQHGEDWPYELVREPLRAADIAFGNLECPITSHPRPTPGKSWESIQAGLNFIFQADPEYSGRILSAAGFDVMSLANNHMLDYCAPGLTDTIANLDAAGVAHVGAGMDAAAAAQAYIVESEGSAWRVGFLAHTLVVPPLSQAGPDRAGVNALFKEFTPQLAAEIAALREQADVVVLSFHWGQEGSRTPAKYQREIAHAAIEAGADLVIGHHPHCIQGLEVYQGKLIAYSLGNFLFTGASSLIDSFILEVTLSEPDYTAPRDQAVDESALRPVITAVRLLPVWVRGGRPEPAADDKLLKRIEDACRITGTTLTRQDGQLVLALP